jgi:lipopolysaccharide export system permease protein
LLTLRADKPETYAGHPLGRFRTELHDRLSAPLYVLAFALIAFAALGQPRTTRQGRGAAIVGEILVSERGLGHYIEHSREMTDQPGMFAGVVAVTVLILLISDGLRRVEGAAMAWRPTGGERGV